jgi:WD40 repeat protein
LKTIKLWDLRVAMSDAKKACVMELKEHEGTIQDMLYAEDPKMLLSASNDGMLGVFDLRKGKLYAMSDNLEED